jgi:hypothetical protein
MSDPVEEMAAAAAAGYLPASPSDHQHHDESHHHDVDVDVDNDGEEQHQQDHEGGGGEGEDAAANSKWSRNGFGAAVPKQVGKFSKDESESVRKAVEEYCAAKQISTARLCSECDHKVRLYLYDMSVILLSVLMLYHLSTSRNYDAHTTLSYQTLN